MAYLTFLLELVGDAGPGAVRDVAYAPMPRLEPSTAFEWKVVCDAEGKVVIRARTSSGVEIIGTARWRDGKLRDLLQGSTIPTGYQWGLVEAALAREVPRATPGSDAMEDVAAIEARLTTSGVVEDVRAAERRLARDARRSAGSPGATPSPRARRDRRRTALIFAALGVVVNLVIVAIVFRARQPERSSPPPPVAERPPRPPRPPVETPAQRIVRAASFDEAIALARPAMSDSTAELGAGQRLLATYASQRLVWADVDVPPETTIGHVLKDPEVERGKRLCVEGELARIERRDLDRRKIYVGSLTTAERDRIAFVAVGSTGELVMRSRGRLCGAVIGRAGDAVSVVGMFDLPENRTPVVEQ